MPSCDELRGLTAGPQILQRHLLDQEERPSTELLDQPPNGGLDVLDEIAAVISGLPL